jgi:hypothetical protein
MKPNHSTIKFTDHKPQMRKSTEEERALPADKKKKDLGSLKQTLPPSLLESSGVSTQMLERERV